MKKKIIIVAIAAIIGFASGTATRAIAATQQPEPILFVDCYEAN